MAKNIPSDPLSFWTQASFRLGTVLALICVAPITIDALFLNGAATTIAALTLAMVGPIAIVCLSAGVILWLVGRFRK